MKKFSNLLTAVVTFAIGSLSTATSYDMIYISSANKGERGDTKPNMVIVHSIGDRVGGTLEGAIHALTTPRLDGGVSAHYLIPDQTTAELQVKYPQRFAKTDFRYPNQVPVIRLVPEEFRAFHAGDSTWDNSVRIPGCEKSLNRCSIGIDYFTPDNKFTPGQMAVGNLLIQDIIARHQIDPKLVLGHSDVAPGRMKNPGPNFPWKFLFETGIGYMPTPKPIVLYKTPAEYVTGRLQAIGYNIPDNAPWETTLACITAYRNHFMGGAAAVVPPTPNKKFKSKPANYGVKPGKSHNFFADRAERAQNAPVYPEGVDEALIQSLAGFDVKALRLRG